MGGTGYPDLLIVVMLTVGLSQISGVDGLSGMAVSFSPRLSGAAHDPEGDCREAEAPIQGRF
jgi:hypothetical protein